MALAVSAAAIHLWAGWADEGRPVLRPVGHLTILAAFAWLLALVFAILVATLDRRGRVLSLSACSLCIVGLIMLISY